MAVVVGAGPGCPDQAADRLAFLGDYLTSEGQPGEDDRQMIADAGFTVEGLDEPSLPGRRTDLVALRRRGTGTDRPANT